jgi:hypothetical protein
LRESILENKEIKSSVKGIVSRLNSSSLAKEEVRSLFTVLFLLRWMKDEIEDFAEYQDEHFIIGVSNQLNYLFSDELDVRKVESLVNELFVNLRDIIQVIGLQNVSLPSGRNYLNDTRVSVAALQWLK